MRFISVFSIKGAGEARIGLAGKVEERIDPVEKQMVRCGARVWVVILVAAIVFGEELPPPRTGVLRDSITRAAKVVIKGDIEEAVRGLHGVKR